MTLSFAPLTPRDTAPPPQEDAYDGDVKPGTAPIITVDHLIKRYKNAETNAVDDISFAVPPGALFALLGPNGAGKTTTISILTTTLSPTAGAVTIAGDDIARSPSAVRRAIGIIFQHPSLDLNLTAEENIRFHATLYGTYPFRPAFRLMPQRYQQQVRELGAVLGIEADLFKKVKTFSGGMKRKLEIVRSLMHHPQVLFLDEPTTGLDPDSRHNLWEYLRQVRRAHGTTIFLTTHYLEEAEEADAICIINHGRIVARGSPAQLKAELVQDYLLLDAADRAALREELRHLGLAWEETPQFKVRLDVQRTAHQILRAITTPLTLVQTHTPTLEDAYLAIVRS
jgi:ABC-2 type transport system ATP-binding protein